MLLGVVSCAPTGVEVASPAAVQDIKIADGVDDLDVNDVTSAIEKILPVIRQSISLFSDLGGSGDTRFRTPSFVGTSSIEASGVDSPFVPNFVIPGYTIPGNRFSPDIKIPSIKIQK